MPRSWRPNRKWRARFALLKRTQHAFRPLAGELQRVNACSDDLARRHPDVFLDPTAPDLAAAEWPSREPTSAAILEVNFTVEGSPYSSLDHAQRIALALTLKAKLDAALRGIAREAGLLKAHLGQDGPRLLSHDLLELWDQRLRSDLATVYQHLRRHSHRRPVMGLSDHGKRPADPIRAPYFFHVIKTTLRECGACKDLFPARKPDADYCDAPACRYARDELTRNRR